MTNIIPDPSIYVPPSPVYTDEVLPFGVNQSPNYLEENGYPITPRGNGYWLADGSIIANPFAAQPPVT